MQRICISQSVNASTDSLKELKHTLFVSLDNSHIETRVIKVKQKFSQLRHNAIFANLDEIGIDSYVACLGESASYRMN